MGRIKPKTVSDLMDIANRFANGEDACNNKWTRSPEDDCNIPRFYQILGEFFFAFVLLEMIGNSQGFKTF
jgi:hypothetical protein